jgi:signal peptidase I
MSLDPINYITYTDLVEAAFWSMEMVKRAANSFFDFLQGIVVFMSVLVMVYLFIISPQEINGASMEPTYHNTELVLTNKIAYKLGEPKRGEVIIFKSPSNKEIDYIKRIIGLPGDRVKLSNNSFYVNDQKVEEPYLPEGIITSPGTFLHEDEEITVPEGEYFVSGDNRPHSSDSREFGPIPLKDIIGRVLLRYWPPNRAGIITFPTYNIQ